MLRLLGKRNCENWQLEIDLFLVAYRQSVAIAFSYFLFRFIVYQEHEDVAIVFPPRPLRSRCQRFQR
jgi:hypothetical protein